MAGVDRLDALGIEPEYLHLPRTVNGFDTLQYFVIHDLRSDGPVDNIRFWSDWDILAVGAQTATPSSCVLCQITIEAEDLEWPDFNAWTDVDGSYALTQPKVEALRDFILLLSDQLPSPGTKDGLGVYFVPASAADYVACGIPQGLIDRFALRFRDADVYRYLKDEHLFSEPTCRFLRISHWTSQDRLSATIGLKFETYTSERIAEIQRAWEQYILGQASGSLEINMMNGGSSLLFTRDTLCTLATLLTDRLEEQR